MRNRERGRTDAEFQGWNSESANTCLEDSKTDQRRNHHRDEHRKPNQHQAIGGRRLSVRAVRNRARVKVSRVVIHNSFERQVFGS